MELHESNLNCQIPCLPSISAGLAEAPPQSLLKHAKVFILRHLATNKQRTFKNVTNVLINRYALSIGKSAKPRVDVNTIVSQTLEVGDWVQVRSFEEIRSTLNNWRQLKGCIFMPEMGAYCGTRQRVLKPMHRFVDERDLRVKKASGILLLEGVMCQGVAYFGSCDRSCYYFWRQEWLDKVDETDKETIVADNGLEPSTD